MSEGAESKEGGGGGERWRRKKKRRGRVDLFVCLLLFIIIRAFFYVEFTCSPRFCLGFRPDDLIPLTVQRHAGWHPHPYSHISALTISRLIDHSISWSTENVSPTMLIIKYSLKTSDKIYQAFSVASFSLFSSFYHRKHNTFGKLASLDVSWFSDFFIEKTINWFSKTDSLIKNKKKTLLHCIPKTYQCMHIEIHK